MHSLAALQGPPRLAAPALIAASISAAGSILCWSFGNESVISVALFSISLPLMYVVIGGAASGVGGPAGWMLMSPVLRYLGKISYGLYVFHLFVAHVFAR
jgi:peptidoglycan/LPS O-acetylase OafA/YrhL